MIQAVQRSCFLIFAVSVSVSMGACSDSSDDKGTTVNQFEFPTPSLTELEIGGGRGTGRILSLKAEGAYGYVHDATHYCSWNQSLHPGGDPHGRRPPPGRYPTG